MANHEVTFSLNGRPVARSDITFNVYRDGQKYGTLAISQGSIVWFPRSNRYGCKLTWNKFHELMKENAIRTEKR